jgi:hypothetical protein
LKIDSPINLVRLGLLKEQLGESVIKHQASPYSLEAKTKASRKGKITKYERFVAETGGLFITDHKGDEVPARVELNIYIPQQIRERILEGLTKDLDGFAYQVRVLQDQIEEQYDPAWNDISDELYNEVRKVYSPYLEAVEDAKNEIDLSIAEKTIQEDKEISDLYDRIRILEEVKAEKTSDLTPNRKVLETAEARLHDEIDENTTKVEHNQNDIPTANDLIKHIESNGGWVSWANECGLELLSGDDIAMYARKHSSISYIPDYEEIQSIKDWIYEQIKEEVDYSLAYNFGPSEEPEDMIKRLVGEEWIGDEKKE